MPMSRLRPRTRLQFTNQSDALIEWKVKHLQSCVPFERFDKGFDAFLIRPVCSINARELAGDGVVQQDHALRRDQSLEGIVVETSRLFGVVAVNEHDA